ncbi:MAG: endonuclease [Bacteroidetes bacterium GWF2_38_335]|nr:MAG: endonuclease [Bacteroidetes bacterium GWF2_38_335]OFY81469.1 MAG: endonuclease [Bacteroidetes bacterium RIFOXYA12_FULL_38_20]
MEKYFTYILYSPVFDKIYIGYTSNLNQRLDSHNHPDNKGWTKKFRPWVMVYHEEFYSKKEAMKREKELKSANGREYAWNMVRSRYPVL